MWRGDVASKINGFSSLNVSRDARGGVLESSLMSRRYVSQLAHQESIDQIFLASEKQLRPNRNGNLYLQLDLSDRSGSINARMWNASEQDYRGFENGDYVRVEGSTQLFQGTIQLIATSIRKAPTGDVNPDDFLILGSKEIETYSARLAELLRKSAIRTCSTWPSVSWSTKSSCADSPAPRPASRTTMPIWADCWNTSSA